MKTTSILCVLGASILLLSTTAVGADRGGKGKGSGGSGKHSAPHVATESQRGEKPSAPKATVSASVHVEIGADERKVIQAYVDGAQKPGRGGGLPPGLAKKVARGGELPPGWQKKCVPGWVMPIEIFHHCHPLPSAILVKLPAPPPGTVLVALDGRVIRVHKESREVHAVFDVRL